MPEQTWLQWLTGQKAETPDEAAKKAKKAEADKRATASIQQAIRGYGTVKKLVKDSEAANAKAAKK